MSGTTFLGRYETLSFLGSGSMGQVHLAADRETGRRVVVKMMHPEVASNDRVRQLFQREMQFMAAFRHPYAVELLEASLHDRNGPCIVMEYIPGVTLEELLARHGRFTLARAGRILGQLCHALQAAHEHGLSHRDLKPANLMVVNADTAKESIKVMDFGLAQLNAQPHIPLERLTGTGDGYAVGTPAYMPPEQIRGDETDHRGDLYSVGVLLFELLTGKLPFDSDDINRLLQMHVSSPPPTFAAVGMAGRIAPPHVEQAVLALVHLCMSKYPIERPQTADELADRFVKASGLRAEPVPAVTNRVHSGRVEQGPDRLLCTDPHAFMHRIEAWMPEKIAVIKLRGFAEDCGGRIIDSEPGLIRMRLREPVAPPPPPAGLLGWLFGGTPPKPAGPQPDPAEVELFMEKHESTYQTRLEVAVRFRPVEGHPLKNPGEWRAFCEDLFLKLQSFLMAK